MKKVRPPLTIFIHLSCSPIFPITSFLPVLSMPTLAFISPITIFTSLHGTCSKLSVAGRSNRPSPPVLPHSFGHRIAICWPVVTLSWTWLWLTSQTPVPILAGIFSFFRQNEANSCLMIFTFIPSWVQHSFSCSYPQLPTRARSYFYSQNTNTISLHLFDHLSTPTSLEQCPYIPLRDLYIRFWRQEFNRQSMRHPCFPRCSNRVLASCTPASR